MNTLFNPNNTTTTFANHMKGPRTYCFGTGREDFCKTVVNRENIGADRGNPGPLEYTPLEPLGAKAKAYKFKYKLDYHDVARIARKHGFPGPGTYEDQTAMGPEGVYSSDAYNNSKAARWAKDERLKPPPSSVYNNPGPGYHEHLGNIGDNMGVSFAG